MADWQASGLRMSEFVSGQEYSVSALRYWVGRLKKEGMRPSPERRPVELARLVRVGEEDASAGSLVLEVGPARVRVGKNIDAGTLRIVLEVLGGLDAPRRS